MVFDPGIITLFNIYELILNSPALAALGCIE
jgi:hypothetical protein